MFTKSLRIGFVGLIMSAVSAWAAGSTLQGEVKDSLGKAVAGAEVHIKAKDNSTSKITRTDGSGRYMITGLPVTTYEVALFVNGAMKASISNSTTRADRPTDLNFKLTGKAASTNTGKKGTHMVYVPGETGTHLGGRWVEVSDTGDNGAALANDTGTKKADARVMGVLKNNDAGIGNSTHP
jgi:Carboxypeptidase regulatory-like domain